MALPDLKTGIRELVKNYKDPQERAKRVFLAERALYLQGHRDVEFRIKCRISAKYNIPYSSVYFCGSAQIGFSVHKDREFEPGVSDLDVACVNADLFQDAWVDIIETTSSFSDDTKFSALSRDRISIFKDRILKKGMILVEEMPKSNKSNVWKAFENTISRDYIAHFKKISIAIYMNEYAFCAKQGATLDKIMD